MGQLEGLQHHSLLIHFLAADVRNISSNDNGVTANIDDASTNQYRLDRFLSSNGDMPIAYRTDDKNHKTRKDIKQEAEQKMAGKLKGILHVINKVD